MDWAAIPDEDPEFQHRRGKATTEYDVVTALRDLGHTVSIVASHNDAGKLLADIQERQPDLVFNLTETFQESRLKDKNVAGLLEMIGIPFTGTGVTGLLLCRDKGLCKQLLALHHVRVPGFAVFPPGKAVRVRRKLQYPMVVKPMFADGSEGIANASLVSGEEQLRERVEFVHGNWQQTAIAEEFVDGRELYIGIIGNQRLTVLPPRELFFNDENQEGPVLATYKVKWDKGYQKKWQIKFGFANLDDATAARIGRVCRNVYHVLNLRDYGRIDLRLGKDSRLTVLEVNPNPDIAKDDEVAEAAKKVGISYSRLIDRILRMTQRRFGRG